MQLNTKVYFYIIFSVSVMMILIYTNNIHKTVESFRGPDMRKGSARGRSRGTRNYSYSSETQINAIKTRINALEKRASEQDRYNDHILKRLIKLEDRIKEDPEDSVIEKSKDVVDMGDAVGYVF